MNPLLPVGYPDREWPYNTDAGDYAWQLASHISRTLEAGSSPSKRVIKSLQAADPRIRTAGFRKTVLDAIFFDEVNNDYDDEEYSKKLIERITRRYGKKVAHRTLVARCEILETWRHRDASMVPDAYLVDEANKTLVCYEVEDSHPLSIHSIGAYSGAWWNLEYIFWDLHLIAYDIYGHPRIIHYPEAGFIAREIRETRKARRAAERDEA